MKVLNTNEVAMVSGAGFFSNFKLPVNFLTWISVGVAGGALSLKNPIVSVLNLNFRSEAVNNGSSPKA